MARYIRSAVKPRTSWIDDDFPLVPELSVDDHAPIDTGLVWDNGEPIMRTPNPIGFGRDGDW